MSCIKWTHRSTRWLTSKITYKLYNTRKFCESKICWEWQKEKSWAKKRHQAKTSLSFSLALLSSSLSLLRSLLSIMHSPKLSFGAFTCWRSLSLARSLSLSLTPSLASLLILLYLNRVAKTLESSLTAAWPTAWFTCPRILSGMYRLAPDCCVIAPPTAPVTRLERGVVKVFCTVCCCLRYFQYFFVFVFKFVFFSKTLSLSSMN